MKRSRLNIGHVCATTIAAGTLGSYPRALSVPTVPATLLLHRGQDDSELKQEESNDYDSS